jgi:ATP-dependent DNA helicase RecG
MDSLSTLIGEAIHLPARQLDTLEHAGILTVRDLLFHFPTRYENFASFSYIRDVMPDKIVTIQGTITKIQTRELFKKKIPYVQAYVKDSTGIIKINWFKDQKTAKVLKPGDQVKISGKVHKKVKRSGEDMFFLNPFFEKKNEHEEELVVLDEEPRLVPMYPEPRGISSRWLEETIRDLLPLAKSISDPIPPHILKAYNLPTFTKALQEIHQPTSESWATAARKRFAFEEIFFIQLTRMKQKILLKDQPSFVIKPNVDIIKDLTDNLTFKPTDAQRKAAWQILEDLKKPHPMSRLLEGDVGSGKTLVALIAALAVAETGFQVAYLAPTEILARQHFASFTGYLKRFKKQLGLLTAAESRKFPSKIDGEDSTHIARSQLLTWITENRLQIVIGTHAILQDTVAFKKLALVIVDEQHRFGVRQRGKLAKQQQIPHFLSMSATPIPRTLALTLYGDLDLSIIDEMPPGRQKPITKIVPPEERPKAYEFIRKNIQAGGQAFVICPMIALQEEGKKKFSDSKAVTEEYKRLKKEVFPELEIGMLHGKMSSKEKEDVITAFRNKKTQMLVSTSVIEVGVDIPNASTMIIEGAERFGLASLHQFRGRVGRGGQKSYCFVFTESKSEKTLERLQALEKAKNGFELANYDLELRGPGELSGSSQWGVSDLGMEALKNIKMVEAAREEARKLLEEDIELKKYPLLQERMKEVEANMTHFE